MPVMLSGLGGDLFSRAQSHLAATGDANEQSYQVVCAWPLSGQYGTGSRVLFYVLVTACIVARKYEWLRDACLAAVLLLPAVAALHGIVLAAVHNDGKHTTHGHENSVDKPGAVDMDIYGAFQLCAIGILAAPVTVRLSQTYFDRPGRNAIFLWTGIIVAGLMSLTVEFYRANGKSCDRTGSFDYGAEDSCGLDCSLIKSPLRTGSVDDIYVIPEPEILSFGTATLLNAALCVHAILWLLSMLDKILEDSSSKYRKSTRFTGADNELIEGTNGATRSGMERINEMVRRCLSVAVVPIFMAAGLAILIVGERNFFSRQMSYRTEPIESIGQWAPIAAATLAVIGSLYLLLAKDMERLAKGEDDHHCSCTRCNGFDPTSVAIPLRDRSSEAAMSNRSYRYGQGGQRSFRQSSTSLDRRPMSGDLYRTTSEAVTLDIARRRIVAKAFVKASKVLGMAAREWTDDTEFQRGRAMDFPEIPGELNRNRNLSQIRTQYNRPRDQDGHVTPAGPARSRASSFIGSVHARSDEDSPSRYPGQRPQLSVQTAVPKDAMSLSRPSRTSMSIASGSDEAHVEFRELSRSTEHHGDRIESPNLLEVPRAAFLTTRSAFGEHHHEPD